MLKYSLVLGVVLLCMRTNGLSQFQIIVNKANSSHYSPRGIDIDYYDNYIVAGRDPAMFTKVKPTGEILWERSYETTSGSVGFKDVVHTLAIAIPPNVAPSYAGVGIRAEADIFLLTTDGNGNPLSSGLHHYKGKTWGWVIDHKINHHVYGSVLAVGGNFLDISTNSSGLTILLTSLSGQVIRTAAYAYDFFNYTVPSDLIACDDGGFLMIGKKYATLDCENHSTEFSVFIMKVNLKLDLEWAKEVDIKWTEKNFDIPSQFDNPQDLAYSVVEYYDVSIGDHVYYLSGAQMSSSNGSRPTRPFVMRLKNKGDIDWVKTYDFKQGNWATSASAHAIDKSDLGGDLNLVIAGPNNNYGGDPNVLAGPLNTFMMMVGPKGKPVWSREFTAKVSTSINVGYNRKNTYMAVNANKNIHAVAATAQDGMYLFETDAKGFSNAICEEDFDVVSYNTEFCVGDVAFDRIDFGGWTHTTPPIVTSSEPLLVGNCQDAQASMGSTKEAGSTLFPNPAKGKVDMLGISSPTKVYFYDMSQELVLKTRYEPGHSIDIYLLEPGIYVVKWRTTLGNLMQRTLKVVR